MPAQAVSAEFVSAFECATSLSVGWARGLSADFGTSFNASPSLTGANRKLSAQFGTSFAAAPALTGRGRSVQAGFQTAFYCQPKLVGRGRKISAQLASVFNAKPSLTGASDTHGFSVASIISDALALWGIFCRNTAPKFAIDRAITDLNSAMQTVWNQANDRSYWTSETLTIALTSGETTKTLDTDVQNVIGPCRHASDFHPLIPVGTENELETFSALYLDGETADEPVAYHIARSKQSGSDPAKCVFTVTPAAPVAGVSYLLDVVKEAPRYTSDDIAAGTIVPIPHAYVESLLLPIVRYHASTFELFYAKEKKESIDREYLEARKALNLADPLPGKAGDNLPKRKEEVSK